MQETYDPGPWSIGQTLTTPTTSRWSKEQRESNDYEESRRVFARFSVMDQGRSRELIAECRNPKNAILIAAAPELLEALKECLPIIESLDVSKEEDDEPMPLIAQVKAAIAKAEGNVFTKQR